MKARIFKYVAATALLLLAACAKEPIGPEPQPGHTIHYSATVSEGTSTRATVDADYHYIFETGDKLYVTDAAGKSYGVLTLTSGAGTTTATFQGELICDNEYQPVDDTELSAVLVSTKDAIHTITNDKVEADRKPITAFATDFADAVSKYGDFTATSTFGAHSFILTQHNSFLIFNVEVESSAVVSTTVYTGSGSLTANVTPVPLGTQQYVARFVAAYPGGTALSGASATVGTKNLPLHNATLTANCYYLINEPLSPFTGFTIRAKENNTTITLNGKYRGPYATYKGNPSSDHKNLITTAGEVQYSLTNGLFWEDFTSSDGVVVVLQAGQTLCLRGTKRVYNAYNTSSNPNNPDTYEPFFTATERCYVGGDLMSLMSTENYTARNTEMWSGGFNGFFAGSWWIENDPVMPLTISATAFVPNALTGEDKNHYKNMFRNCTHLTTAPALPVTTLKVGCYMQMFYGCTSLTTAPDLPASALVQNCYYEMFRGCTQLNYIKCLATSGIGSNNSTNSWVSGVSGTGIFVKYHKDTNWNSPGASRIPPGWAVQWVNE